MNSKESEMEQVITDCRAHESANEQLRQEVLELCQKLEQHEAQQPQEPQEVSNRDSGQVS